MYDSRNAWTGRAHAVRFPRSAVSTKPVTWDVMIARGRSTKPKGWWGPPTHPHSGCTAVAGWGIDHHVPTTDVPVVPNDGATRGYRRLPKVPTISELTGVKSTLSREQSARIREFHA